MFRAPLIADLIRLTALIILAGAVCYGLALGANLALTAAAPWLGTRAARVPELPLSLLSRDQMLAMCLVWALLALGLGGWPFALRLGRVIAEGVIFVLGVLIGAQLHIGVLALLGGADPLRVLAQQGLQAALFCGLSLALLWLPEACAGLRLPGWLRAGVLLAVLAVLVMGAR